MKYKQGETLKQGRYLIKKEIGSGGTANVYLAFDKKNRIDVALKISLENAKVSNLRNRFLLEAKVLKRINSKNVVKIFDLFQENDSIIIVLEYIDGKELKTILENKKTISPRQAIRIILEIINGLKPLLAINHFHRDIKPNNIMIGYDNIIRIMDFGIVQESENQLLTKQGNIIGSIKYMAPELIKRERKAHEGSEIYSLGILIYEMLSGATPFYGSTIDETAMKIVEEDAVPISKIASSVNTTLNNIIMKMIEKNYLDRYQKVTELEKDLKDYQNKYFYNVNKINDESKKKISFLRQIKKKNQK